MDTILAVRIMFRVKTGYVLEVDQPWVIVLFNLKSADLGEWAAAQPLFIGLGTLGYSLTLHYEVFLEPLGRWNQPPFQLGASAPKCIPQGMRSNGENFSNFPLRH